MIPPDKDDLNYWMKDDGILYFKKENYNKDIDFAADLIVLNKEFPNLKWKASEQRIGLMSGKTISIFAITDSLSKIKPQAIIKIDKNNFFYCVIFGENSSLKLYNIEDAVQFIKSIAAEVIKFHEEKIENIKKEFGV